MPKREVLIAQRLDEMFPDAKAELNFTSNYELLVAVILSAQCTDVRVNIITKDLFQQANTPEKMVQLGEDKIREIIKSCGMFRQKAKNLYLTSNMLLEYYDGEVPGTMKELISLPGVGRKTANVVLSNAFGVPAIAVDTHVLRVSNRLGFIKSKKPEEVEEKLMKLFPKELWSKLHHQLIFLGRRQCMARNPQCPSCHLNDLCPKIGVKK